MIRRKERWVLALLFAVIGMQPCLSTPLNNVFDTQPLYNVFGLDKFYKERDKGEIRLHISPFYQSGSTARNDDGIKVPAGDRLGKWNMFGIFFGQPAAPTPPNPINFAAVPPAAGMPFSSYLTAGNSIRTTTIQALSDSRYRVGPMAGAVVDGGLTAETNFKPEKHTFAYISQPTEYEKLGVRSQLNFDFGFGLGVVAKGGVVDIKNAPSQFILEKQFGITNGVVTAGTGDPAAEVGDSLADAKAIFNALFESKKLKGITSDLGINLNTYRKTAAEDLLLQLYWHFPFDFEDRAGDVAVTVVPYLAAGAWVPVNDALKQNNPFAVPVGNDGYYGFVAEGSLAFDFPVVPRSEQTLQVAVGGGVMLFNEMTLKQQRFPSSPCQAGLIPWQTDIRKTPGITWYFNGSMKAEEFVDGLSVYLDYMYTQHLRDSVTILESTPARLDAFKNGLDLYKRQSAWTNQQVNAGFNYRITDSLMLGGAVQGHISGVRVMRTVTVLGSITLAL